MFLKKWQKQLSKTERATVIFTLAAFVISGALLFNNSLFETVFGFVNGEDVSKPIVGHVDFLQNDTRFRPSTSLSWRSARNEQAVRLDDNLFTGDRSSAHVRLKNSNSIHMGANTLIVFRQIEGMKLPDLSDGNFRLQVKGEMKLAINGEVTTIDGKDSEVQVYIDKSKKPQIKLLKGEAVLKAPHHAALVLQKNLVLPPRVSAPPQRETASVPPPAPAPPPPRLIPLNDDKPVVYTNRLYDHYELNEGRLARKTISALEPLTLSYSLKWDVQNGAPQDRIYGQITTDPSFKNALAFTTQGPESEAPKVFVGDNYWRLSLDGKTWTEPAHFKVYRQDLADTPHLRLDHPTLTLDNSSATAKLSLQSAQSTYVVESSHSPDFPSDDTRAHWVSASSVELHFHKPGRYYYRARAVNAQTEISSYSETQSLSILPEKKVRLPQLTIHKQPVVAKPLKKAAPPMIARKEPPPERAPSNVVTTSTTTLPPLIEKINQQFSSSKVEIETGLFSIFSPDEEDVGHSAPQAVALGLRLRQWFEHGGIEASFRVKASNGNREAQNIDPFAADLRYHYLLKNSGGMQSSLFAGYEIYRNSGTGYFAPKYDLIDLGFSMDFPFKNRWDMGGEALIGIADDNSRKYQLSGRINYYLEKNWSLGVGYRVYLFQAGSEKSAPLEYPYKEAYGEGFSALQWHY